MNPHRKIISKLKVADGWAIVLSRLKLIEGEDKSFPFRELNMNPKSLGQKFRKDQAKVLEISGTSKEGANLSGLDEQPS